MRMIRSCVVVAAMAGLPVRAQEDVRQLAPADASSVLVDVVVRDGKGRPVTDLLASDFEVLEDGVVQALAQFGPPPGGDVAPTPAAPAAQEPAPGGPPGAAGLRPADTLAFVFDRLSTSGRVAAQKAARGYLEKAGVGTAGVFSIEDTLVVLQEFTSDKAELAAAIEALGTRVALAGSTRLDQQRAIVGGRLAANRAQQVLARTPDPRQGGDSAMYASAKMNAMRLSLAQAAADMFDQLERDEHGFTTANALTAIVDALRTVPGRKAIVLFSGGLYRTESNEKRFLSVIHAANRASVAVYAIEADGLQGASSESLTGAEVQSVAATSRARQEAGTDIGGGAFLREMEAREDLVKYSPRASLEWISDSTGGAFVRDTNDLSGALARIGSDLRSYYLLGYAPKNEQFDGRFRKIAVRVKRKGLSVSARSGYFAVRSSGPVLAHVAPALAVLESSRRTKDIRLFGGANAFPAGLGPARTCVVVTVPAAEVTRLASALKNAKDRLDVTLLARVLAPDGKPVDAMSRRFVVERSAKIGDLLLLRDTWLPPGAYTLEAVVYGATSGQSGTLRSDFQVEDGARPLGGAQVVVVKGAVPVAEAPVELEAGHPLRFGDVLLQPLSGEPITQRPPRPFIVQVTAPTAGSLAPSGSVTVFRGETVLATVGVRFGAPEPGGLRRHVLEVPVGALEPGDYEVRATLKDAGSERLIRVPFAAVP